MSPPRLEKRGLGLYKIHIWNKYKEIKGGEVDLTSNRYEAYNSAMKISLRMKPNIWCILKQLKDEEALNSFKIAYALSSQPIKDDNPARTRKRLQRAENLAKVVNTWGSVSPEMHVKALHSHFTADE